MAASVTRGRALRYAEGSARGLLHHHPGHCPFTIRQNWIAPSLNTGGRPLLPALGARHTISLSSQISSDPRCFRASLYDFQFVVR